MEAVFRSFCSFGADKMTTPLMDGTKLVKMCRDLKLLDKNLTSSDVDIIFSKVKSKTERKINFKQFEQALKMIAGKKYPGVEGALDQLKAKILEGEGPVAHGVTVAAVISSNAAKAGAVDQSVEASSRASSSRVASAKKAANADISSKAKVAVGGTGKPHPVQTAGKSTQSRPTNGRVDGKAAGGKLNENKKDVQKQNRTPVPDGKDNGAALGLMVKENTEDKESPPGKNDAQTKSEAAEKDSKKDEKKLTVGEYQETQAKQDS